ncbi:MAG: chemotaxis protein CheR [Leptolyngbya sp.]|nr:MAG: chemotaxis protein CheR [Leptolyngbya sp.]
MHPLENHVVMNQMISDRPISLISNSQPGNDLSLLPMIDLIADTLGIHIQPQHQTIFKTSILTRIKALGLSSLNEYYQYLVMPLRLSPGESEWHELIPLLTITESYFFRDQGQFWLLKNQILPELIERQRQLHLTHSSNGQKPALRLWSAGCSSGEEAYSLAILVQQLVPDYQTWDILILGTDINYPAIALAQQGIYNDWSFRTTDLEVKNRYFRSHKKGWQIDPAIRGMVTFQLGNLVQDDYPNYTHNIYDLDLILCRNVFIYFDFNAITKVVDKFYRALAPGGFLITGHTELHGQKTEPFQVKSFPQSAVYQRKSLPIKNNSDLHFDQRTGSFNPTPCPSLSDRVEVKVNIQQDLLEQAQQLLIQEAYTNVIQTAQQLIALAPQHFQASCLMAEAYANLGQYADATQACQQALQINALAIEPYYLLAQISEEQGDTEGAKLFLKRIMYLAPMSVPAYLELGSIYEREGNSKQAQKTWRSLLEVLQSLPPEQAINDNNQQTVAELKAYMLKH